jgi:hypothetical protein
MPKECAVCKQTAVVAARITRGEQIANIYLCENCVRRVGKQAKVEVLGSASPTLPKGTVFLPPVEETDSTISNAEKTKTKKSKPYIIITLMVFIGIISWIVIAALVNRGVQEKVKLTEARDIVIVESQKETRDNTIEKIYKEYPSDYVIKNLYFYTQSMDCYKLYEIDNSDTFLSESILYAQKIDPNYSGPLDDVVCAYRNKMLPSTSTTESNGTSFSNNTTKKEHEKALSEEDRYNALTDRDKKKICDFIDERYAYYDSISGGYAGDKYSDTIWKEASEKFQLSESHISIIWMNKYKY